MSGKRSKQYLFIVITIMTKVQNSHQVNNKENLKKSLLSIPFYMTSNAFGKKGGIVNLADTQYEKFKDFADKWDQQLPGRKGSFNPASRQTIKQLLYLAAVQMEQMRKAKPSQYLMYLSDHCDTFPVYTSRHSLASICEGSPCGKTIYNHLKLAQKASIEGYSIVVKTSQSSSRREFSYDPETGETSIIHRMTARGHGDLIVYVSKKAFLYNYELQFLNTDNQGVKSPKRKNLPALIIQPEDTLVSDSIMNGYGASQPNRIAPIGDGNEMGHPVNGETPPETQISLPGGGSPLLTRVSEVFKSHDRPAGSPSTEAEKGYWRNIMALDSFWKRTNRRIPKGNARHACIVILTILYRQLLFPRLSTRYWERIEEQVQARIALHLDRASEGMTLKDKSQQIPLFEAFRLVRRGIVKVHENMFKHPDRYAEGSLRVNAVKYLDLDAGTQSMSFKKVMDTWVMGELKRTMEQSHHQNSLFKWQVCFREKEKLVKEVYKTLVKQDYHAFMAEAKIAFQRISDICNQTGCPEGVKRKLINSYLREVSAVRDFLTDREFHEGVQWVNEFVTAFRKQQYKVA